MSAVLTENVLDRKTKETKGYHIVVYNDDVNSFGHVIESFVQILGHTPEQAEQCSVIINDKGSCSVKNGTLEDLTEQNDALHNEGIDSYVEKKD